MSRMIPLLTEMDESQTGGQIRTKTRLNYEAKSSYTVTVIVRDPSYDPTGDYIGHGRFRLNDH